MLLRPDSGTKQCEGALRQSQERYALAIAASTDGHAEWNAESDVFYCSPRLLEQWDLPAELAITRLQQMLDVFPFHSDDRDRVMALLDAHCESNSTRLEFDTRVLVRGEVRWMHVTTLYLRDRSGKLLRIGTATTDITARRRAEEELRISEERYALALAGSDESIYDWDLKTDRVYLAPRTQELFGIPIGEVWRTRDEWAQVIRYHPDDEPQQRAALEGLIAGGTPMYDICLLYTSPSPRDS